MIRKKPASLTVRMLLVLAISALIAGGVFWACTTANENWVHTEYMSADNTTARSRKIASEFQSYVKKNGLSSNDLAAIARWTRENNYVNILVYKDGRPKYEAGSWGVDSLEGSRYEEVYAAAADTYSLQPVIFSDGLFQIVIDDFSYTRYYTLGTTVSLFIAFMVMVVCMIWYMNRITRRVRSLSSAAREVEHGNLDFPIPDKGRDEIAYLGSSVNSMRLSMQERIRGEEQARKANAELITAMSHDIRTPLTTLIGYLELLQDGAYASQEQLYEYVDTAHDKSMRLKELTDELFRYFLVFSGSVPPAHIEEYDAQILLEQMLGEHEIELRASGWRLVVKLLHEPCFILADAMSLKRVFDNIFSNVTKHADKARPVIILSEIEPDGQLHVTISNSIPLVPNKVESTKIGLRTCEKTMESMGGRFISIIEGNKYAAEVIIPVKKIAPKQKRAK